MSHCHGALLFRPLHDYFRIGYLSLKTNASDNGPIFRMKQKLCSDVDPISSHLSLRGSSGYFAPEMIGAEV